MTRWTLLLWVIFLLISIGCSEEEECSAEIRITQRGTLSAIGVSISDFADYNEWIFINEFGEELKFNKREERHVFDEKIYRDSVRCSTGEFRPGFHPTELIEVTYTSPRLDTIRLSLYTLNQFRILNANQNLNHDHTQDWFRVFLKIGDCEPLNFSRSVTDSFGESELIENGFPYVKFNIVHYDTWNITSRPWIGGLRFGHRAGLVAFNHCGQNFVQIAR